MIISPRKQKKRLRYSVTPSHLSCFLIASHRIESSGTFFWLLALLGAINTPAAKKRQTKKNQSERILNIFFVKKPANRITGKPRISKQY